MQGCTPSCIAQAEQYQAATCIVVASNVCPSGGKRKTGCPQENTPHLHAQRQEAAPGSECRAVHTLVGNECLMPQRIPGHKKYFNAHFAAHKEARGGCRSSLKQFTMCRKLQFEVKAQHPQIYGHACVCACVHVHGTSIPAKLRNVPFTLLFIVLSEHNLKAHVNNKQCANYE